MSTTDLIRESSDEPGVPFPVRMLPLNQLPPPGSLDWSCRTLTNTILLQTGKHYDAVKIYNIIICKLSQGGKSWDSALIFPASKQSFYIPSVLSPKASTNTSTIKALSLQQVAMIAGPYTIQGCKFVRLLESEDRGETILNAIVVLEADVDALVRRLGSGGLGGAGTCSEVQLLGPHSPALEVVMKRCLMVAFQSRRKSRLELVSNPRALLRGSKVTNGENSDSRKRAGDGTALLIRENETSQHRLQDSSPHKRVKATIGRSGATYVQV